MFSRRCIVLLCVVVLGCLALEGKHTSPGTSDCPAIYKGNKYCKCTDAESLFTINSLELPEVIKLGQDNTFSAKLSTAIDITETSGPASVSLSAYKALVWVPIPCLDGVGSCDYANACEPFKMFVNLTNLCPILTENGVPCDCPIKTGSYSFSGTTKVNNPGFGWLANGEFYAKIQLQTPDKTVHSCYEVYVQIQEGSTKLIISTDNSESSIRRPTSSW